MLADEINIGDKSFISYIFGRRTAGKQMNKTCTLVFSLSIGVTPTEKHKKIIGL
jgi:hypothetical protein